MNIPHHIENIGRHEELGFHKNNLNKLDSIINNTSNINVNTDTLEDKLINGTAVVKVMGSEDPSNPSATQKQIKTDGNGNIMAQVVNTLNIQPSNSTNSHLTDDPDNSVCVAMTGRQIIGSASSQTHLLCDNQGKLEINNSSNSTALTGIQGTLTDAETHLSAVDTNIVNIRDAINAIKIFNQDSELHLSSLDTNISNRLPSTIGPKDESLSLTISRNNTPGAFSMNARTNITDRATEKFLLCNDLGHLSVSQKRTYSSETSIVSSQSVSGSSTHTTAAITNDANVEQYLLLHDFSGGDVTYEILEGLSSSGSFFNALGFVFNEPLSPSSANQMLNNAVIKSPFFKIKFTNGNASARDVNLSFVSINN